MDIFKVLGNSNRRSMLQILLKKNMHISALAKELNISVPVALKHTNILEEAGLVERQHVGTTHLLKIKKDAVKKLEKLWSLFEKPLVVEVKKGENILNAMRKVPGIKIETGSAGVSITAVDGTKGYFVYAVDGKLPDAPADKFKITKDIEIELQRLVPVIGKKILIKVE